MSLLASLFTLFTSVSEARSVEAPMDLSGASDKAAEVFEALAAQVPPMLVELPAADAFEGDAPPNM
jgi:hypothetical protein